MNHFFYAFNNPVYYPGKIVDGVIVLVVQSPIKVTKIGITWRGSEYVSWYQGVSHQEHCTALKIVLEKDYAILNEEEGRVLTEGTYTYNFQWELPQDCPANFEEPSSNTSNDVIPFVFSSSGMPRSLGEIPSYIRYHSTAYVNFSFIGNTEGPESPKLRMLRDNTFKVAEAFDPSILIQNPVTKKELSEFWLGGDPLEFTLSVANGGVLFAGQNIYVNLSILNKSTRSVDGITFIVSEKLTFMAPNLTKQDQIFDRTRELLHAEVADSAVPSGGQFNQDLMFMIPPATPATITKATHIKRTFDLACVLQISFGTNPQITVPLRILDWSPLVKDDLPKQVPITIRPK